MAVKKTSKSKNIEPEQLHDRKNICSLELLKAEYGFLETVTHPVFRLTAYVPFPYGGTIEKPGEAVLDVNATDPNRLADELQAIAAMLRVRFGNTRRSKISN